MHKFASCILAILGLSIAPAYASSSGYPFSELSPEELAEIARAVDGNTYYIDDYIITRNDLEIFGATGAPTWVSGQIFFEFAPGVTQQQQTDFMAHCAAWQNGTPVRCFQRTNEPNFVFVSTHAGEGCGGNAQNVSCSRLGMVGGRQELQIFAGHWTSAAVIRHEIGHALGLIHEHQRSDRDRFVTINAANVEPGRFGNFRKVDNSSNHTNYDYNSIMHYDNCAFARSDNCTTNANAEQHWTIIPAPCARFAVGGRAITQLDLQGINTAYAGRMLALFETSRRAECGTHTYSKSQVEVACGPACGAAGQVTWTRLHEVYDWGCGFLTVRDGPAYCTAREQEFVAQWYDRDPGHIKCWGGTLVERWTQCGCSVQTMNASCTNFSGEVNAVELAKLSQSEIESERASGKFITRMMEFEEAGYITGDVAAEMPMFALRVFAAANERIVNEILCQIKVEITIQKLINRDYVMPLQRMQAIIKLNGLVA